LLLSREGSYNAQTLNTFFLAIYTGYLIMFA